MDRGPLPRPEAAQHCPVGTTRRSRSAERKGRARSTRRQSSQPYCVNGRSSRKLPVRRPPPGWPKSGLHATPATPRLRTYEIDGNRSCNTRSRLRSRRWPSDGPFPSLAEGRRNRRSSTSRQGARRPGRLLGRLPRADRLLAILEDVLDSPRTCRMPSVAVYADSGMGKTMLLKQFVSRHGPHSNAAS